MSERHHMSVVRRRLIRLRAGLRLWQLGAGASRIVAVLALLVLLSLVIDHRMRMDRTQRLLSLLTGLAVLIIEAWRVLMRPLLRRVSDEALLLRVERLKPELDERLVAAWEFDAMTTTPEGSSPALVSAAIAAGNTAAAHTDFSGVLDWSRFRRRARIGLLGLAALAALAIVDPQTTRLWFARNVLLRDVEWPRQTRLLVQGMTDGVLHVPVAGDLELLVRAQGVPPAEVLFRYADESGTAYSEQMPLAGDTYRTLFRGVTEPFRVQISGGDDRTEWIPVRLLPRPELGTITVRAEPPAYTKRQPGEVEPQSGVYAVPAGSSVTLQGQASLPLRAVTVAIEGSRVQALSLTNATQFALTFAPKLVKTGTYQIEATASTGVATLRPTPVALRVEPDRPPRVAARLDGIGPLVLSRAEVPIACDMQDDYGVAAAWLEYQCQSPTGRNSGPIQAPLPLPATPPTGGVIRLTHAIELAPLRIEPDATISIRAVARDNNTLSGPGQSQSLSDTLRVVTEEDLRQDLTRREQMLRQRLERLIQEQRALADESRLFHAGTEPPAATRGLQAEKRQRQVPPTLAPITAGLAQIRAEAYHNRLEAEPSPLLKRLDEAVLAPLRDAVATLLPEATDRVAAARRSPDGEGRREAWRQAEEVQRRVIGALMDVRKNLAASDALSDVHRLMEEILRAQKDVNRETTRKTANAIEGIFDK